MKLRRSAVEAKACVIVVDIGCLECWNESVLLGVYDSFEAAQVAHPGVIDAEDPEASQGGSHRVVAFRWAGNPS